MTKTEKMVEMKYQSEIFANIPLITQTLLFHAFNEVLFLGISIQRSFFFMQLINTLKQTKWKQKKTSKDLVAVRTQ